jgi:hypothetical protein
MVWHLEFYNIGADGVRSGTDLMTDASPDIDGARAKAKSINATVTFSFGPANRCVIKKQDGTVTETLET